MAKIKPIENGPLIAENVPSFTNSDRTVVEGKEKMFLCRCGQSKNKPYCDGSHKAAGFESDNKGAKIRNEPIEYRAHIEGRDVMVSYTPVLCGHIGLCQHLALDVFNPKRKPWIELENGSLADIEKVVKACPSGALSMSVDGEDIHHVSSGEGEKLKVAKNGPYIVRDIELDAEFNGKRANPKEYILCRCGQSKNKPFCDGTHYDVKWDETKTGS